MIKSKARKLLDHIDNSKGILIISHSKPDGDTLGSALALSHYCDQKCISNDLLCIDKPASYFEYLPKLQHYHSDVKKIHFENYDTIVCVDHGALHQSQLHEYLTPIRNNTYGPTLINLDHHSSNDNFGNINFVTTETSSTCEIIYNIFNECNVPIDKKIATCLMTGIITDTMNFTNSATKQTSLHAASDLVSKGAKIPEISTFVVKNKNIESLNLWGKVFNRLKVNKKYGIAHTFVMQEDFEDTALNREAIDGLVNFLTHLENVRLVMLLVQEPHGIIKGSFRTHRDDIDVAKLASVWGGGGHKKASGFHLNGTIKEKNGVWAVV